MRTWLTGRVAAAAAAPRVTGILMMVVATLFFASLDTSAKWLNLTFDPLMTTWSRYAFNVAAVSLFLNPITTPGILRANRLGLQLIRSALLIVCTILNFVAFSYLQLTQAMAIQFAMPLLVALLAGPLLGEWAGPRRLAAIAVGFCGVLVVTRPFGAGLHPAAILVVASTVLYAFYAMVTRMLAAHDRSVTTVFYSGLVGLAVMTPILPFVWTQPPSALHWLMMAGTGVFSSVGHGLIVLAHARAPAPILAPFIYVQIVWVGALGFLVFGDVPDASTVVGATIVILSGLYLLYAERSRRAKR